MVTPSSSFWRGKRVLLTGHTGFKGSWASIWLRELGAQVHGLALPPETSPALWQVLGSPCEEDGFTDVREPAAIAALFDRVQPEILIHMAAQALVHPSYDDPALTFDTNVMGLVHVLDRARFTRSVKAIVNVTSDKCYENREQVWAYRENEPMGGSDPYSASKGCAELVTASYQRSFFSTPETAWLASARAGNVIGGGDWSKDRLVPDSLRAFADGRPVSIRNPGSTRPWQHVLEPVCGYLILAQALYERGEAVAEGWNFGPADDDAWPVRGIVDHLAATWGNGATWQGDLTRRPHEAMLLRVDAAKARAELGWRPRLGIGTALDWTIEWTRAYLNGSDAAALTKDQIMRFEALDQHKMEVIK